MRDVGYWHLATFRCTTKFGSYWGNSGHRTGIASINVPRKHAREWRANAGRVVSRSRGGNHHRVFDVGDYLGGCPRTKTFSLRLSLRRGGHSNTPTKNPPLETGGHLLS